MCIRDRKIITDFMDQLNFEYEINVSKTINQIDDEKAIEYITEAVNELHEVSSFESDSSNSILKSSLTRKYDEADALKLINRFLEKEHEEEIAELRKNMNGLTPEEVLLRISNLRKQINELRRL
jgi:translation elongation factor EF-Tu-like GTPase